MSFVKSFGVVSILLASIVILVGMTAFEEKFCVESWFLEGEVLCKECNIYLGEGCINCYNETTCQNCTDGYFLQVQD